VDVGEGHHVPVGTRQVHRAVAGAQLPAAGAVALHAAAKFRVPGCVDMVVAGWKY